MKIQLIHYMIRAVALEINSDPSNKAISLFLACNMLIFLSRTGLLARFRDGPRLSKHQLVRRVE